MTRQNGAQTREEESELPLLAAFFAGRTSAWGLFEDRFGTLRRRFHVDIDGTLADGELRLDERFLYDDGEREQRTWRIREAGEGHYTGTAGDVVGTARGRSRGDLVEWSYLMDLPLSGRTLRVRFEDRMVFETPALMVSRSRVSKFGLLLGTVTMVFRRFPAPRTMRDPVGAERVLRLVDPDMA